MDQICKRFTAKQVQVLLKGYCQGMLDRPSIEEILGICKTTSTRLPASVEKEVEAGLMLKKGYRGSEFAHLRLQLRSHQRPLS